MPVVIFQRESPKTPRELHLGSERHTYLSFQYLYSELSSTPAEEHWHSDNLVARLNLPNMQWSQEKKVDVYAQAIRGLLKLEPDIERQLKYIDFIDIYSALDDNEMTTYQERYPQETQTMTGLRERLLAEGMQEGERVALFKLLTRRFDSLDDQTTIRIQQASAAEVEEWLANTLDAGSIEDVFTRH